jgi:hypothetical protein
MPASDAPQSGDQRPNRLLTQNREMKTIGARNWSLLWVYSYGAAQDHLLNADTDRVADVFTDEAAIAAAGWSWQEASDLLAVLGPRLVGIAANRIPMLLRRLQGRRFSEWQADIDAERAARQGRRQLPQPRRGRDEPQRPFGVDHGQRPVSTAQPTGRDAPRLRPGPGTGLPTAQPWSPYCRPQAGPLTQHRS